MRACCVSFTRLGALFSPTYVARRERKRRIFFLYESRTHCVERVPVNTYVPPGVLYMHCMLLTRPSSIRRAPSFLPSFFVLACSTYFKKRKVGETSGHAMGAKEEEKMRTKAVQRGSSQQQQHLCSLVWSCHRSISYTNFFLLLLRERREKRNKTSLIP